MLLPARDEAARVGPTLRSLMAQRGVELEVVVLDDGSTDGTADVVRRVADDDPRVRLLTGRPLTPGWLGKPHACQQLAEAAARTASASRRALPHRRAGSASRTPATSSPPSPRTRPRSSS